MNGIEKITARIAAEAEAEALDVREKADARIAEIKAESDKKAQEEYWSVVRSGANEAEQRVQLRGRAAALEAKKSILAMKQELVSRAFDLAGEKILAMPESDYVAFLAKQAADASFTGQEEIILNENDRTRFGDAVVKEANACLKDRGIHGGLSLSETVRPLTGGLILKQGDIEVNCALDKLLDMKRGELSAQVAGILFE